MFYEIATNLHGLPHDPLKALVVPRPIGWISTRSGEGALNLAPYSFFNMIDDDPPLVLFSSGGPKDSATFAAESGEFVANFVSEALAVKMNATAVDAPRGTSEFDYAELTPVPSNLIATPRVGEAFAALECKVTQVFTPATLPGTASESIVVIGQVVGVHIDDAILTGGMIDIAKARPVARLGYLEFTTVRETYVMRRPKWKPAP